MDIFFGILLCLCYAALFVVMIFAAAAHNWFAFVGWLLAWLLATILAAVTISQR